MNAQYLRWLTVLSVSACLALPACTPSSIPPTHATELNAQLKTHGIIVGFEGLQPFSGSRILDLTTKLGDELGLAHAATTGNCQAHLPFVEEAARHGQPVYIVGYSLGAEEGRRLADLCKARGVPVRILFLLDPRYLVDGNPDKVPDNVARAVFYTSPTYRFFVGVEPAPVLLADRARTSFASEYLSDSSHGRLPGVVAGRIKREIAADLNGLALPAHPCGPDSEDWPVSAPDPEESSHD